MYSSVWTCIASSNGLYRLLPDGCLLCNDSKMAGSCHPDTRAWPDWFVKMIFSGLNVWYFFFLCIWSMSVWSLATLTSLLFFSNSSLFYNLLFHRRQSHYSPSSFVWKVFVITMSVISILNMVDKIVKVFLLCL